MAGDVHTGAPDGPLDSIAHHLWSARDNGLRGYIQIRAPQKLAVGSIEHVDAGFHITEYQHTLSI